MDSLAFQGSSVWGHATRIRLRGRKESPRCRDAAAWQRPAWRCRTPRSPALQRQLAPGSLAWLRMTACIGHSCISTQPAYLMPLRHEAALHISDLRAGSRKWLKHQLRRIPVVAGSTPCCPYSFTSRIRWSQIKFASMPNST